MTSHRDLVMLAASIAARLGNGKHYETKAGGWMTCCPAHDDETPSLQISVDQNIRFLCYSGCEDEAIRAGLAQAGFQNIPEATNFKSGGKGIKVNKVAHEERPPDEWFLGHDSFAQRVPDHLYTYRNANGQPIFLVARIDKDPPDIPRKLIKPVCSARAVDGELDFWSAQTFPGSRPLYNLDDLARRPEAPVLLVEGEKAADAARLLCPAYVVVTWSGGSTAVNKSSWMPLTGRDVWMWPDNDEAGMKAMRAVAKLIAKGRKSARSIHMVLVEVIDTFPAGFDLGDPYTDDLTPLSYMLENAANVDQEVLPDVPIPADDEEVADKVKLFLEKYAAMSVGMDHQYIDLTSRSPHVTDTVPYMRYSKHSLEQREAEAYVELATGKAPKRRRYIDSFVESPKKLWLDGYNYDPSSLERILTRGERRLLNLYCGFAYKPNPCSPEAYQCFIDHIYASVENREEGDYILDWFAAKLQNPEVMIGTMVILSGREGCGKTIICDIICRILGSHNAVKVPMSDLNQSFNSQYANKLLLSVEEYNPGANKQQRDLREKVKNLVTSQTILVNAKFMPAYENKAYHSVIATTNARTTEDISFDNRRMSFVHFDNQNLKMLGGRIDDDAYFAPLVALSKSPEALSGLCHFLMTREVSIGRVMKPLSTSMSKEAKTFVENPVCDFLRTLADTGVLVAVDEMPNKDNPFPTKQWPLSACAIPRSTLNQMFREHVREFRRQTISRDQAGRMLAKALNNYPRGIPESYAAHKTKRWNMSNTRSPNDVVELVDRAFCLPDIAELRFLVEKMAGEPIDWSEFDTSDNPSEGVVVDFPGKTTTPDPEQF
jgi:hypothetical protein